MNKLAKKATRSNTLAGMDPAPFHSIGVPVPNSHIEVHQLATKILFNQKAELKVPFLLKLNILLTLPTLVLLESLSTE